MLNIIMVELKWYDAGNRIRVTFHEMRKNSDNGSLNLFGF